MSQRKERAAAHPIQQKSEREASSVVLSACSEKPLFESEPNERIWFVRTLCSYYTTRMCRTNLLRATSRGRKTYFAFAATRSSRPKTEPGSTTASGSTTTSRPNIASRTLAPCPTKQSDHKILDTTVASRPILHPS